MNWVSDECMVNATNCWDPTEKPGVGAMARPNTPLFGVLGGIRQYAKLGIPADKLVIALPCTRIQPSAFSFAFSKVKCEMSWCLRRVRLHLRVQDVRVRFVLRDAMRRDKPHRLRTNIHPDLLQRDRGAACERLLPDRRDVRSEIGVGVG